MSYNSIFGPTTQRLMSEIDTTGWLFIGFACIVILLGGAIAWHEDNKNNNNTDNDKSDN